MKAETRHVKYAFADIVDFSVGRTVEAQVEIVTALNKAFKKAAQSLDVIFLPTGDGVCAGIIEPSAPADAHLQIALKVLSYIYNWSEKSRRNRPCTVRFGIDESVDTIVTDINGQRNLAGSGINRAQRLMSIADGNQIILGQAAHDTLCAHDDYENSFRPMRIELKGGRVAVVYQFLRERMSFLNTKFPSSFNRNDPIDLDLKEALSDRGNFSTPGQVRCVGEATERWKDEMENVLKGIVDSCPHEQVEHLLRSQRDWEQYLANEKKWVSELRNMVRGSVYRVLGSDIDLQLVRQRVELLREYRDDWIPASDTETDSGV